MRFRQLGNADELVEVFLGLKRNVEVEHLKAFEVRFGIPLPLRQFAPATHTINIDPYPIDLVRVTVRSQAIEFPSGFEAELIVPPIPNLPIESLKYLIKSPLFSFLVSNEGQLTFWHSDAITSNKQPIIRWINHVRLLIALASGKATIEIRGSSGLVLMELDLDELDYSIDITRCKNWLTLFEQTQYLFQLAGVSPDMAIAIANIEENVEHIVEAFAILSGKVEQLSFSMPKPAGYRPDELRGLVAGGVGVGEMVLGYYATVELTPDASEDRIVWRSKAIIPGAVRALEGERTEFVSFLERARSETRLEILGILRLPVRSEIVSRTPLPL